MASPRPFQELSGVTAVVGEKIKSNILVFAYLIALCGILRIRVNIAFEDILSYVRA